MTLLELLTSATYLMESLAAPGQWDRSTYLEAINWAITEAAKESRCTYHIASPISCAASDNRLTLVPAPLRVLGVKDTAMGKVLLTSDPLTENALNPNWRYLTGTPTAWFEEAGNLVRLNRKVVATTSFDVEVLESPSALTLDAHTVDPRIPDHLQLAVRYGAAFYLLTQAGDHQDLARAHAFLGQFRELVTGRVASKENS